MSSLRIWKKDRNFRKKAASDSLEDPGGSAELHRQAASIQHPGLEGALNRVIAVASLSHKGISVEIAEEALKDIVGSPRQRQVTSGR